MPKPSTSELRTANILQVLGWVSVFVAGGAIIVIAHNVLFVLFLAVMFACLLHYLADFVASRTPVPRGVALSGVITGLVALVIGAVVLVGFNISAQIREVSRTVNIEAKRLEDWLSDTPGADEAMKKIPLARDILDSDDGADGDDTPKAEDAGSADGDESPAPQTGAGPDETDTPQNEPPPQSETGNEPQAFGIGEDTSKNEADSGSTDQTTGSGEDRSGLSSQIVETASAVGESLSDGAGLKGGEAPPMTARLVQMAGGLIPDTIVGLVQIFVIIFVAIFLAAEPRTYQEGVARLFPERKRAEVFKILRSIGETMFKWLLGRFAAMVITGIGTAILLYALQVPLAGTVAFLTGLLTFIPNIGAAAGLVLAVAMATSQGLTTVIGVVVGYLVLQLVETNVITPLIERRQVSIPPAVVIALQLLFGVLFGFLGVMVATPVLACMMVVFNHMQQQPAAPPDADRG